MSGVYRCKLKRREIRPRSPVPPQKSSELTQVEEKPDVNTKEEPVKIIAEAVPVKTDVKAAAIKEPVNDIAKQKSIEPVVERHIEPLVVKEPVKHNAFHLFNNASVQRTTKRGINVNPLLRRRL